MYWRADAPPVARRIALIAALATALVAGPAQAQTTEARSISVEGSSFRQVRNDTARFTVSVTAQRRTAERALGATALASRRVLASLSELGIARADVRTTGVSVRRV